MEDMTKFLAELLFSQLRQALTDLAPVIGTAVVGFATVKINQVVKTFNEHKAVQTKSEKRKALEYAAVTFVRSQYEKDRAAFKSDDPTVTGVDPALRKATVIAHLTKIFPEFSEDDIDAACDAAVFFVRPEKVPTEPTV